eukprot:5194902-Pleurochrysis_carterae.AAC.1
MLFCEASQTPCFPPLHPPGSRTPAVNPMIAHGRTAADVQADLNNFRHKARQQAAATEGANVPIFQGEYLLVQLAGTSDVALHRWHFHRRQGQV